MEKLLNEITDLKVEQLKFEVKFDKKINELMEKLNELEAKIEAIK
ncbi:MAG: hypothetical protein PHY09_08135 [Desulfuromonadaceae bacterium]|nr:hypothetical protein [Desulfuromonadaceae bacterium]MDD5106292.1 hypothetical protein [Desulfuromonadaceae bacterium]